MSKRRTRFYREKMKFNLINIRMGNSSSKGHDPSTYQHIKCKFTNSKGKWKINEIIHVELDGYTFQISLDEIDSITKRAVFTTKK